MTANVAGQWFLGPANFSNTELIIKQSISKYNLKNVEKKGNQLYEGFNCCNANKRIFTDY